MSFTLLIVIITALISFWGFSNSNLLNKLILYPYEMNNNPKEYYRLLTSGFIHGDLNHLFFNMFTMYCFGNYMEELTAAISTRALYLLLYFSAIIIASLPSFFKHRNDSRYLALGASGGVSAVLFAFICFEPWAKIQIMFIPIGIPAIIFGVLYLAYTAYMAKRGNDNVGHDAHFTGAIYGFLFAIVIDPTHGGVLVQQLFHPVF